MLTHALQQTKRSLDDPVTRYLPQLAGSAYEGVTTRQLLHMASGAQWDETYIYPASDRRRMLPIFSARSWGSANLFSQPAPRPDLIFAQRLA